MRLVYKFRYMPDKINSIILSSLTYASARLFNVGNYERKEYKKLGFDKMPNWYDQKKRLKNNKWFKALPAQTSQDILKRIDEGWKSYFELLKTEGIENPNPPFYKVKGSHFNIKYLNNSFKFVNDKTIRFMISKNQKSYLNDKYDIKCRFFYIELDKRIENIKQVEFKYIDNNRYDVYIIYEIDDIKLKENNGRYVSIDLGICNLATIYDNKGNSFIISGNTYQNTLYYYNKKIAHYQSILRKQTKDEHATSKRLSKLYEKKKSIISYIIHASTKKIVNYCVSNDVTKVIIGDITGIRKNKNIGKVNNQKLHSLPYREFYEKLEYKLRLNGIELIYQNEAYTSSCPIDSIDISKEYQNKGRIQRGLYKDRNIIYNADCVGAYNIMRLYRLRNAIEIPMEIKGLSNPNKISICVTSND